MANQGNNKKAVTIILAPILITATVYLLTSPALDLTKKIFRDLTVVNLISSISIVVGFCAVIAILPCLVIGLMMIHKKA